MKYKLNISVWQTKHQLELSVFTSEKFIIMHHNAAYVDSST